ncbi:MAG: hypothetical protein KatS3mg111_2350 [Pirellulaceae bacterium]|nr:MAG: hypothetical protein KatS3mg111_2350 [Pirellulaceae bacterium]
MRKHFILLACILMPWIGGSAPWVIRAEEPANRKVPFGPFHLPPEMFGKPFNLTMAAVRSPADAIRILQAAKQNRTQVLIHLSGGRNRHRNPDGSFSLERFTIQLQRFKDVDFQPFVEDGTLIGHLLFDEPHDPSNWNGRPVPYQTIDAAAAASKRLFPELPTGVGSHASFLAAGAPFKHLDFVSAQYSARRGEFQTWLQRQVEGTQQIKLKLVISLNVLDGGDPRQRRQPMSAIMLQRTLGAAISEPTAMGVLMWKWDPGYFNRPDIRKVLAEVAGSDHQPSSSGE